MRMRKKRLLFLTVVGLVMLCCYNNAAIPTDNPVALPDENRYIALTFDDGPHHDFTEQLLDGLRQRGASATFFLVGEEAEKEPELVHRMQAEGHQIGNHTWGHMRLKKVTEETLLAEVGKTEALLESLLGEGDYWLRPPYGEVSADLEHLITVPMVKWSVDPRDWESRNREKIVQAVLEAAEPNSIVLLHDIYQPSVEAALEIMDRLQAQGYDFVTVEELLRLNGVTPQAGKLYRSGKG